MNVLNIVSSNAIKHYKSNIAHVARVRFIGLATTPESVDSNHGKTYGPKQSVRFQSSSAFNQQRQSQGIKWKNYGAFSAALLGLAGKLTLTFRIHCLTH